jgi:signal transduction histidine kinase
MWRRSIRARMALGFVLAALPLLAVISLIVVLVSARRVDTTDGLQLQLAADRVAALPSSGRQGIDAWNRSVVPETRNAGISFLMLNHQGQVVRQTRGPVPPWPWPELIHVPGLMENLVRDSNAPSFGAPWETGPFPIHRVPWTSPAPGSQLLGNHEPVDSGESEIAKVERQLLAEGSRWRIAMVRLQNGQIVVAAAPHSDFFRGAAPNLFEMLAIAGLVLLAVAAGAWFLVGRVLSPIGSLAAQASAVSSQGPEVHLEAPSRDAEVVHLVSTLNGLLARVAQTAAVRGRFYAAASHELRTPLQALSGHLEVALSRERTASEYQEALAEASSQTQRLARLTTDLLLLNRLEAAAPEHKEQIDVRDVVEQTLRQFRRSIQDRGLRFQEELEAAILIVAPPAHLEMLVRNLVENAVQYTKRGGNVKVALVPGQCARLEITNDGSWDPVKEGEQLLEPFYRPDSARSSSTGGNGLGLAICRAITEANGWRLCLGRVPGGICAAIEFVPRLPGL